MGMEKGEAGCVSRLIVIIGHKGECLDDGCDGVVKMSRNRITMRLDLDYCWCTQCGEQYHAELPDGMSLDEYDGLQWAQKAER